MRTGTPITRRQCSLPDSRGKRVATENGSRVNTEKVSEALSTQLSARSHRDALRTMETLTKYLETKRLSRQQLEWWLSADFGFVTLMNNNPLGFVTHFYATIPEIKKMLGEAKIVAHIPTGLARYGALEPSECSYGRGIGGNPLSNTTQL